MSVVAVIPARAGSKGIPRKNLIDGPLLGGRPLLTWTVDAAAEACETVIVSTDDEATLRYAGTHPSGRVVGLRRPEHLCTDTTPTEPVIAHALGTAADDDAIVLLQLTSPLRTATHITVALETWREGGYDTLSTVEPNPGGYFGGRRRGNTYLPDRPPGPNPPRQSLTWIVRENGAIYIATAGWWRAHKSRIGGRCGCYLMSRWASLEIDEPSDLIAAEALLLGGVV